MAEIMQRIITVNWMAHNGSDLMVAVSPDLKGLIVHGRSARELNERTPVAIRAILEAEGHKVEKVVPIDDGPMPAGFTPSSRRFEAIAA